MLFFLLFFKAWLILAALFFLSIKWAEIRVLVWHSLVPSSSLCSRVQERYLWRRPLLWCPGRAWLLLPRGCTTQWAGWGRGRGVKERKKNVSVKGQKQRQSFRWEKNNNIRSRNVAREERKRLQSTKHKGQQHNQWQWLTVGPQEIWLLRTKSWKVNFRKQKKQQQSSGLKMLYFAVKL